MAITHDDLNAILGDIDDAKVIEILALTPTVAELEEAAIWAKGYGDVLAKEGRLLTGTVAEIAYPSAGWVTFPCALRTCGDFRAGA